MKRLALASGPLLAGLLASAPAGAAPSTPFTEELLKARDPFKRPEIVEKVIIKGDLEHYPVEAFTVVGILTGPMKLRAMLLGPDGRTHFAAEAMKIGTRGGAIRKITPNAVFVREKVANVLGQEEILDSKLPLREKESLDGKPAGGLISTISPIGGGPAAPQHGGAPEGLSAAHGSAGTGAMGQLGQAGLGTQPAGSFTQAPSPAFQSPLSQSQPAQGQTPQGNTQPANPGNLTPPTATWGQTNQPPPGRATDMFAPSVGGVIIPQGGAR